MPSISDPVYSYAVTELHDDQGRTGVGLAFTLGEGNQLVCEAAKFYAQRLVGKPIEEIMAGFGKLQRAMADEQQFRWLGPAQRRGATCAGVRDECLLGSVGQNARRAAVEIAARSYAGTSRRHA